MTVFNIFDESGQIVQSNKVFDPAGYAEKLKELDHRFVAVESGSPLPPDRYFVRDGAVRERPDMPVTITKAKIKAGGTDGTTIAGIPIGASIVVTTGGLELLRDRIGGGRIDITIPVPCIYHIVLDLWPFKTKAFDIEATA